MNNDYSEITILNKYVLPTVAFGSYDKCIYLHNIKYHKSGSKV